MHALYWIQLVVHVLAAIQAILSINLRLWKYMDVVSEVLARVTDLTMIFVYIWQWQTFITLMEKDFDKFRSRDEEIQEFQFWVTLEIILLLAIVIVNVIYLFTRGCIKPKFTLET